MCRKGFCLFLALVMIMVAMVGCNTTNDELPAGTTDGTTASTTTATSTTPKPEEPEKFYSEKIIKDGDSEYSIVYNLNDIDGELFAKNLTDMIKTVCGITLKCEPAYRTTDAVGGKEIVVGAARSGLEDVKASLKTTNDFAVKLKEESLVLYATGHSAYSYLLEYLKREIFSNGKSGDLTVTSDDNIVYSSSKLKSTTFIEYWREENNTVDVSVLSMMFEPRIFENPEHETMPYRLYVPMNYDSSKKYPVLIFLHGAGERGTDNGKQYGNLLPTAFSQNGTPLVDAIIIAPQCPAGKQWVDTPWANGDYSIDDVRESDQAKLALEIFEAVTEEFSTDEKRYYVTGLSMGGFGTWDMIMRHSDIFAGAVPVCGGADSSSAANVLDVAVWTVHDPSDPTVPYSGTKVMVDAIIAAGGTKIKFDSPTGYGHGSWNYVAKNVDIYKWLFQQTK